MFCPGPDTVWQADHDTLTESAPVTLTYDNGQGLVFHRKIAVDDRYMFTVTDSVENKSAQPVTLHPYAFVKRHGKPVSAGYSILHEGFVGVIGDSGVQQIKYDKIEKEDRGTKSFSGTGGWLGLTDKYWARGRHSGSGQRLSRPAFRASVGAPAIYQSGFVDSEGKTLAPGTSSEFTTRVFAGAKETDTLDRYQANLGIKKFDLLIDWGWFYFITKPMFRLLDLIYKFVGNFGVAILFITVLVKAIFFPLANRSYLAMAKMKMVQPQILAIRDRFPDDKHKQQMEVMALYKREKINPALGLLAGADPNSGLLLALQECSSSRSRCGRRHFSAGSRIFRGQIRPTSSICSASFPMIRLKFRCLALILRLASGPSSWASPCSFR